MLEILGSAAILVHIASLLYVIAFIIRDQLILRVLVLIATGCYIGYYYFIPDAPLWDAIVWSTILGLANIWVMTQIIIERTTFRMSDQEMRLFKVYDVLSPGEFRKLLKITNWHRASEPTQLTEEGQPVDRLIYVLDGEIQIQKQERHFTLQPLAFIGEVAFFRHINATATTTVNADSFYVSWPNTDLRKLLKHQPGIRVAMNEMLNRDMADKVAAS